MNKLALAILGLLLVMQASARIRGGGRQPIIWEHSDWSKCGIMEGAYELGEALEDLGGNGNEGGYLFTDSCEVGSNNKNGQDRGEYRKSQGDTYYGPRVWSTIEGDEPDQRTLKIMDLFGRATSFKQTGK